MDVLALDSDRWNDLGYNSSRGDLPQSLVDFLNPDSSLDAKTDAIDVINDQIFHQTSTYEATYVVLPILILNWPDQHPDHQFFISHLAGLVSLEQGEWQTGLSKAEIQTFATSQQLALDQAIYLLQHGIPKDFDHALDLACAIVGLSGQRDLGWRLRHRREEDRHQCSSCDRILESNCFIVGHDSVKDLPDYLNFDSTKTAYATPINRIVARHRVTPREKFPEDSKEGWITTLCEQSGHPKCAQWLRCFFGSTTCPHCEQPVELLGHGVLY